MYGGDGVGVRRCGGKSGACASDLSEIYVCMAFWEEWLEGVSKDN